MSRAVPSLSRTAIRIGFILLILMATRPVSAQINPRYREGDWQSFTSLRYVTSYAISQRFVYFGTEGGVARYDRNAERWLPAMTTAEGLPSNIIEKLAYDPLSDDVYALTPNGPAVYYDVRREWRQTSEFPDSLSQPWHTIDLMQHTLPFGYDALDPGYLTGPHLRSYRVHGAVEDSWGNLWVGTWGQFIWMQSNGAFDLEPQRWGLYHDNVDAIFIDGNVVYFGGTNYFNGDGGLSIYDTLSSEWFYVESRYTADFPSDRIRDFEGWPGGRYLYMATDDGVVRYDHDEDRFRSYSERDGLSDERINAICLDRDILWVASEYGIDGIYLPADSVFSAVTEPLKDAWVFDILVTGEVVWIGTDRGLFRLAKPIPEWQRFATGTGPLSGRVRALTTDGEFLYVGADHGIAVIDLTGSQPLEVYEAPTYFADDNIFDIAVTDSIIWLATPTGLIRFVPDTREQRVFTTADGIIDLPVQTIEVEGDYLWLGTPSGATRFRWNNPMRID